MCLVLYLGTDVPRPEIAWDESAPRFHVIGNDADAQRVAGHLRKRFVYYVGSDNGCGCGFRREYDDMLDDEAELASKADNQNRLAAYVAECLENEDTIELYSCWSGDEEEAFEDDRTLAVADLLANDFWFAERQRTIVVRDS